MYIHMIDREFRFALLSVLFVKILDPSGETHDDHDSRLSVFTGEPVVNLIFTGIDLRNH